MADEVRRYVWREATFEEAVRFMQGRTLADPPEHFHWPESSRDGHPAKAAFSDGSIVVAFSDWTGPWSALTPDTSGDPPEFWIGEPEAAARTEGPRIAIRPVDIAVAREILEGGVAETREAVRRLEEAQAVPRRIMDLEIREG